jgi:aryl-alcohol dehydrogenase-like predicted oxidoreductase
MPIRTNQSNSKLALGTVQFGLPYGIANQQGQVNTLEVRKILEFAISSGIDTIDTAIRYGNSEQCLGTIGVQNLNVVTKVPPLPDLINDIQTWVDTQFHDSLKRLNISKLYALLLHRPIDLVGRHGQALYRALLDLKEQGLVEKIGVSVYSPDELRILMPLFSIDIVQGPLNVIDRRLENSGWLAKLKDQDIEIHTRSVFLQGLLLMSKTARPEKFSTWETLWNNWHNHLDSSGVDFEKFALSASLSYPLSLPEVDRVLVGIDSCNQLESIIIASQQTNIDIPDVCCNDERLVNPANWADL